MAQITKELAELTNTIHNFKVDEKSLQELSTFEQVKEFNDMYKEFYETSIRLTNKINTIFFKMLEYSVEEKKKEVNKNFYLKQELEMKARELVHKSNGSKKDFDKFIKLRNEYLQYIDENNTRHQEVNKEFQNLRSFLGTGTAFNFGLRSYLYSFLP